MTTTETITDPYIYALIVWAVCVVGILVILIYYEHKGEDYSDADYVRDLQIEDDKNETL